MRAREFTVARIKPRRSARARAVRLARKLLSVVLLTFVLLAAGDLLFKVRQVEISGAEQLEREKIMQIAGVEVGGSTLVLSFQDAEKKLLNYSLIREAEVQIAWPARVVIKINERRPAASILYDGQLWAVDEQGTVLFSEDKLLWGFPLLTGLVEEPPAPGNPVTKSGRRLEALKLILQALNEAPGLEVAEINLSDPDSLMLYTTGGLQVLLGEAEKLALKLKLLCSSMPYLTGKRELFVDLRLGDRLVVLPLEIGKQVIF